MIHHARNKKTARNKMVVRCYQSWTLPRQYARVLYSELISQLLKHCNTKHAYLTIQRPNKEYIAAISEILADRVREDSDGPTVQARIVKLQAP